MMLIDMPHKKHTYKHLKSIDVGRSGDRSCVIAYQVCQNWSLLVMKLILTQLFGGIPPLLYSLTYPFLQWFKHTWFSNIYYDIIVVQTIVRYFEVLWILIDIEHQMIIKRVITLEVIWRWQISWHQSRRVYNSLKHCTQKNVLLVWQT